MDLSWEQVVVDAHRPATLGRWWAKALGWLDAEVERLLYVGARRVDVGQRDASWVVLADPEGNEFCILRGRHQLGPAGPASEKHVGGDAFAGERSE